VLSVKIASWELSRCISLLMTAATISSQKLNLMKPLEKTHNEKRLLSTPEKGRKQSFFVV